NMSDSFSIKGDLLGNAELQLESRSLTLSDGSEVQTWGIETFSKLRVQHMVGSISLVGAMTGSDEELVLLRGSLGQAKAYQKFAEKVNAEITGEPVEQRGRQTEDQCPKCGLLYPDPASPICPKCLDKR